MSNNLDFFINELRFMSTRKTNTGIDYPIIHFERLEQVTTPVARLNILLEYFKLVFNITTDEKYVVESKLVEKMQLIEKQQKIIDYKKQEVDKMKNTEINCGRKSIGNSHNSKLVRSKLHYIGLALVFNLIIFIIPILGMYDIIPKMASIYGWGFLLLVIIFLMVWLHYKDDNRDSLNNCKLDFK